MAKTGFPRTCIDCGETKGRDGYQSKSHSRCAICFEKEKTRKVEEGKLNSQGLKTCSACGAVKPLSEFYKRPGQHKCKACFKKMPSRTHEGRQKLKRAEYERKGKEYRTIEEIKADRDWTPCEHSCEWCYSGLASKRTPEKCARAAWNWFLKNKASEKFLAIYLDLEGKRRARYSVEKARRRYNEDPIGERGRVRKRKYVNPEKVSVYDAAKRIQLMAKASDGTITSATYEKLVMEFKRCPYCGKPIDISTLHLDHMEPLSLGGLHGVSNVIACCAECNLKKASQPIEDWIGSLPAARQSYLLNILNNRKTFIYQ